MSSLGDWPVDLLPYRGEFYLQPNTRAFLSPVTRTRQVLAGQGPRWIGTWSFRFKTRRKEQRFESLLDKLKGQVNTVNVWDFANKFGLGLGSGLNDTTIGNVQFTSGSPAVLTGFYTGSPAVVTTFGPGTGLSVKGDFDVGDETVRLRGFRQNDAPFLAGDQIQIGSYLYRITEDVEADGIGVADLSLNRPLVEAVEDYDTVVITRPKTPMQLLDDDQSRRSVDVDHIREYTISFVEVLPI